MINFYLCRQNDFYKKSGQDCNHFICHMLSYKLRWKTDDVSTLLYTSEAVFIVHFFSCS